MLDIIIIVSIFVPVLLFVLSIIIFNSKNQKIKNKHKVFSLLRKVSILMPVISISISFIPKQTLAKRDQTFVYKFDNFKEQIIQMTSSDQYLYDISEDDISNLYFLIPQELFSFDGEKYFTGSEYGFYLYTDGNYNEVFIYDIEIENNPKSVADISFTINPLIQLALKKEQYNTQIISLNKTYSIKDSTLNFYNKSENMSCLPINFVSVDSNLSRLKNWIDYGKTIKEIEVNYKNTNIKENKYLVDGDYNFEKEKTYFGDSEYYNFILPYGKEGLIKELGFIPQAFSVKSVLNDNYGLTTKASDFMTSTVHIVDYQESEKISLDVQVGITIQISNFERSFFNIYEKGNSINLISYSSTFSRF